MYVYVYLYRLYAKYMYIWIYVNMDKSKIAHNPKKTPLGDGTPDGNVSWRFFPKMFWNPIPLGGTVNFKPKPLT